MRICIVGAGAIGGWVAARLALAGEEVMALTNRGPLDGLEITEAGETQRAEFRRFEGPADLLVIAVKATALGGITESVRPLIGAETIIVPMLNGVPWWFVEGEPLASVDPNGRIAASFQPQQIIGCVVHASSSRAAPDRLVVKHADKLIIGEPDGTSSERLARLYALLDRAGLRPDQSAN
ncbi:MAG TPA: 2-dehydropantoate 2-reductase N-terminal domain-containing protein, partial [Sphingomicrobium sp.]|nr:2-dehydropantoate 2-reductase N-terminal domain-containing protein [Sphingomicrobium sp.]